MDAVDRNYRVVMVVDDDANANFINQRLTACGYHVERLPRGKELINGSAGHFDADLVILDAAGDDNERPRRGLALGRQLKTCPHTVAIPVIVVGKSSVDRLRSFEFGVDDYVSVDTSPDEFQLRLDGLLRVSTARRDAAASQLEAEVRRRKMIGDTFRRYVSPGLVDQILGDVRLRDSALADKSTRVHATVLFADMRGFTRMSEQLEAADVVPLLNEYFSVLTEVAFKYEGTVFNMSGDCLMVGFGVPFEQADQTVRAFRTSREMLLRFSELVTRWKRDFGIEAGLGIGINEGEVIAGNVGSSAYMSYTIIGDAVNVAARLGQRARAGEMLFPSRVKDLLDAAGEECGAVLMQPIALRGRTEPLDIFCVPLETRINLPYASGQ